MVYMYISRLRTLKSLNDTTLALWLMIHNTSECETFGSELELLAAVHSSLCSSRQSVSQLQLDHDTTALPGVLINWHYHRHYHSLTLASLHTACMLEIALAMWAICTVE